ncbi:protein asteroid homolog 1-like [Corticium candelabrum]|uniref:protein asteroid homolog 1-like n=1 Tax=Corticium candelabrum TaxID=121492 RepID=UPI002E2674B1|nr:protein asteroid homolog 1-like [Corticium candelabrum]
MGIRGLTSFMKGIRAVWTSTCLSSTKLVIDGNNLLFHLYISSGLDMQCGGQYLEYYQLIRVFFSTLKKHHIEAVVVLDGVDEGDLKLPTRRKRANEKIGKAQTFDCVPPLFIEQVFFQAAADSDVELKMCDYEGDTVAAQLANSLCCPVLSNDSDFYILDIRLGLIPINTFEWQQNGGPIRCQSYHRDAFLRHINLSDEFLPLLAVLIAV